ncbi:hypothetical protein Q7P35_005575 [Cladosporium inversicolor]
MTLLDDHSLPGYAKRLGGYPPSIVEQQNWAKPERTLIIRISKTKRSPYMLVCQYQIQKSGRDAPLESYTTRLFRAVRTGEVKTVKRICQGDRVDVTTRDPTGRTVLHIGAEQGGPGLFHFLLECSGLNINAADDNGKTALFYAAQFERVVLLQRLLSSYGALVNVRDKSGRTALSYAVQRNSYRSTELLLEAGAEIALEDDHGRSPLFYAVEAGNCAATVRLVRHMKDGNPALLLAGQMGRTKIQSKPMTLEASIADWETGILQKLLLQSARSGRDDMVRPLVQFHGIEPKEVIVML